jgi:hypothetical protein
MFGGRTFIPGSGIRYLNDLFAWDGRAWTLLHDGVDGPEGREFPSFVYDAKNQRMLLVGGRRESSTGTSILTDVWEWKEARWKKLDEAFPERLHGQIMYSPTRQSVLVYGGLGSSGIINQLIEFSGGKWTPIDTAGPPGGIPIAGGADGSGLTVMLSFPERNAGEVWRWSNSRWESLGPAPAFSSIPAAVRGSSGFMVFESWPPSDACCPTHVQAADGKWQKLSSGPNPGVRSSAAIAYDPLRQRVLLFGGNTREKFFDDTWEWDGKSWVRQSP